MRPLTDRLDLAVFGGPSIIRVRQEFASATAEENSVPVDTNRNRAHSKSRHRRRRPELPADRPLRRRRLRPIRSRTGRFRACAGSSGRGHPGRRRHQDSFLTPRFKEPLNLTAAIATRNLARVARKIVGSGGRVHPIVGISSFRSTSYRSSSAGRPDTSHETGKPCGVGSYCRPVLNQQAKGSPICARIQATVLQRTFRGPHGTSSWGTPLERRSSFESWSRSGLPPPGRPAAATATAAMPPGTERLNG